MNRIKKINKSNSSKKNYSFINCCWNCHLPGHIGRFCRLPRILKCSLCLKLNVKTSECNCRSDILSGIPRKLKYESLRIEESSQRLVIDVKILADIFTAAINPGNEKSYVNEAIVKYVRLANIEPKSDQSIDIGIDINNKKYKLNCLVNNNLDSIISLGCKDLLKIGIQFNFGNITISKNPANLPKNTLNLPIEQRPSLTITISNDLAIKSDETNLTSEAENTDDDDGVLKIMWDESDSLE